MVIEPIAAPDLPVIWWVFWLVAVAVGVFGAFAWWLTRAALREDAAPPADHEERPEGAQHERDSGAPGR